MQTNANWTLLTAVTTWSTVLQLIYAIREVITPSDDGTCLIFFIVSLPKIILFIFTVPGLIKVSPVLNGALVFPIIDKTLYGTSKIGFLGGVNPGQERVPFRSNQALVSASVFRSSSSR